MRPKANYDASLAQVTVDQAQIDAAREKHSLCTSRHPSCTESIGAGTPDTSGAPAGQQAQKAGGLSSPSNGACQRV